MLIIFDLDDTLIDTSGTVTPYKMKECLASLIREGLAISNFEEAYRELLTLNASALKSRDALERFVLNRQGSVDLVDKVIEDMIRPLPQDFSVSLTPNAKEILEYFSKTHKLALVTGGHPPFQMEKLEKAGIDRGCFSKIAIPEDSVKGPFYKELLEEFSAPPNQTFVCGDRVAMDLLPAHELGMTTVHMRWGRGKIGKSETWVHHVISDLFELKRIIAL